MEMNTAVATAPQATQTPPPQAAQATAEEAALFDKLFATTDGDKSGSVGVQELGDFLEFTRQQNGSVGSPLSGNVVNEVLRQADISGDGTLDQSEFTQFLQSAMKQGTEASSGQAAPATLPGETTEPGTGTMVDPSDTAAEMTGCCACAQGETSELEALFAEYDTGYGANVDSQNKMIEFRNWLQHTKGMDFDQANTAMLAMTEAQTASADQMLGGVVAPEPMGLTLAPPITPVENQAPQHSTHQA